MFGVTFFFINGLKIKSLCITSTPGVPSFFCNVPMHSVSEYYSLDTIISFSVQGFLLNKLTPLIVINSVQRHYTSVSFELIAY